MITEIGHFALVTALVVALLQAAVPLFGAHFGNKRLMAFAGPCASIQAVLLIAAFLALMNAFVTSDFSVELVRQHSHSAKPMIYKITGVWANHEGSMLLWVLFLALYGGAVAWFGGGLPTSLYARVLGIQGLVGVGFIAFIIFTSNPFERVFPAPLDGNGLNPLLQDPALAAHPPMLYLGYVGFSIAFSFAIAALLEGKVDSAWARWVRPWTLAAWSTLTLGIALGSWWAYYELGWGGWWFWDPVENASLMPWLVGTALLHSVIVVERREALKAWTVLLAIVTFGFSLLGTFLVRSGILTSVHAFAVDPDRGLFILALLVAAIGGGLTLYAVRAARLRQVGHFAPVSREGALLLNNFFMSIAAVTVLLGTLYPLLVEAVGGERISVGPPYFAATFVPLMAPMLVAMGVGPMLAWKQGDLLAALRQLSVAFVIALVMAAVAWYVAAGEGPVLALVGIALAAWLVVAALSEWFARIGLFRRGPVTALRRAIGLPRAAHGMCLAHFGAGILVAGAVAATAWKQERIQMMGPGDIVEAGGYQVRLDAVKRSEGPNYLAERASMSVLEDGVVIAEMTPERRFFPVEQQMTTEAAIRSEIAGDLYAVIGEADANGTWVTRIYYEPLVGWIWFGAVLMAAGGALALTDRRQRVDRRRTVAAGAAVPSGA